MEVLLRHPGMADSVKIRLLAHVQIVGNGYVTRELNMGQQSYLYRVGHSWMSEQDFHEVFAV
jgi:hypothetical protein